MIEKGPQSVLPRELLYHLLYRETISGPYLDDPNGTKKLAQLLFSDVLRQLGDVDSILTRPFCHSSSSSSFIVEHPGVM